MHFSFTEEDLSPKLRRAIGQMAERMDYYDVLIEDKHGLVADRDARARGDTSNG